MAFRAEVRRALQAPLGGPLGRLFLVPAMTAIVTDGRDEDREVVALAEVLDALVRVGVPRGRQYVLVARAGATPDEARVRTRRLRAILGVPVIAHDPSRPSLYVPGALADGTRLELDDELREAEEVVVVGGCRSDGSGGPWALWPGLGREAARADHAAHLPAAGPERGRARLALARQAHVHVPSALALFWDAADPPRVRSGATLDVLEACAAAGWFDGR